MQTESESSTPTDEKQLADFRKCWEWIFEGHDTFTPLRENTLSHAKALGWQRLKELAIECRVRGGTRRKNRLSKASVRFHFMCKRAALGRAP